MTEILAKLRKVKKMGNDRFLACCPAHDDKHPSLAIRFMSDGRTLIHCFSGCSVTDIIDALGLNWSDLMPERSQNFKPVKYPATDVLAALDQEAHVVQMIAVALMEGKKVSEDQKARLRTAVDRIFEARRLSSG